MDLTESTSASDEMAFIFNLYYLCPNIKTIVNIPIVLNLLLGDEGYIAI